MSSFTDNFSRKKLQQLLAAAAGPRPAEDATQIEAAEYDWHQSHYFDSSELKKLDDIAERTAVVLAEKLTDLCHNNFNVTAASTTQHFADELFNQASENTNKDNYHLAFGIGQDAQCGIVSIPSQTATILVTQLLGDSESKEDSDKVLSQLEESLLLDVASAIIEILSRSCDKCDFHPAGSILKGPPPLEVQGTEEVCKMSFNIKKADSENSFEVQLLMLCDALNPIAGKTEAADGFSKEDTSKAIFDHLQEMSVSVIAQLGSATLTFEEVMGLHPRDILLLDKGIDEPVKLIAEGRTLFHGRPAKSTGKYAVVITKLCDTE